MSKKIIQEIQVNVPFTMLYDSYLSLIMEYGINPEIGFDATALDRFSSSDFEYIAKQIHERGLIITLHSPFMDLSPGSPDPAVLALTRHRYEQMSQLVPIFQPKTVVCHSGYDHKRYWGLKDTWIKNSQDFWSWFAQRIIKDGAVLMLENVFEHNPHQFLELYEGLRELHVGFCLDTGHQAVFSRVDLSTWLEVLGGDIRQIHLHDNSGNSDDHLALGKGKVDFRMLFEYLRYAKTHPPIITLEPHREEDLWPSLEYLESIWPW